MNLPFLAVLLSAGIILLSCGSGDRAPVTPSPTDTAAPAAVTMDTVISPEADTIYRGGQEPLPDPDKDISP